MEHAAACVPHDGSAHGAPSAPASRDPQSAYPFLRDTAPGLAASSAALHSDVLASNQHRFALLFASGHTVARRCTVRFRARVVLELQGWWRWASNRSDNSLSRRRRGEVLQVLPGELRAATTPQATPSPLAVPLQTRPSVRERPPQICWLGTNVLVASGCSATCAWTSSPAWPPLGGASRSPQIPPSRSSSRPPWVSWSPADTSM